MVYVDVDVSKQSHESFVLSSRNEPNLHNWEHLAPTHNPKSQGYIFLPL